MAGGGGGGGGQRVTGQKSLMKVLMLSPPGPKYESQFNMPTDLQKLCFGWKKLVWPLPDRLE